MVRDLQGPPRRGALEVLLGDGRRLFANHFFVKADVYLHSGYYPSIFDAPVRQGNDHISQAVHQEPGSTAGHEGHAAGDDDECETAGFLAAPKDWIDSFSRSFFPSRHTHLERPGEAREILPWLKLSAELDPQRVETYVVAAYWLRTQLNKVDEAEQFLREGRRANPDSYEILFELGRVFYENRKDPFRARNVWELALKRWEEQQSSKAEPNRFLYAQITGHLARLEESQGNLDKAVHYFEMLKTVSPYPAQIQKQIDALRAREAGAPPPNTVQR